MKTYTKLLCALPLLATFSTSHATAFTDVQDFSNNSPTEYFLDVDANKYNAPYYRGQTQDWGWTHGAITSGVFAAATLNISAFDVDFSAGEHDYVSVWTGSSWLGLGNLGGASDAWAFTTFDLAPYLATWATTQINSGLKVAMNIDTANAGWIVTLAKSTLSVNGGSLECVPQPGVPCGNNVPEPESFAMMLLGLPMIAWTVRRRKSA
jgi:hypothetical protein